MYDRKRLDWWIERSLDESHQRAYDTIFENLPRGEVFLDLGCGTGEIISRAAESGRYRLIVGTDSSSKILEVARENVSRRAEVSAARSAEEITRDSRGVVLLEANTLDTGLPADLSDVTLLCFTDFSRDDLGFKRLDDLPAHIKSLMKQHFKNCGETPCDYGEEQIWDLATNFQCDYELARLTAPSGKILTVEYIAKNRRDGSAYQSTLDGKRRVGEVTGQVLEKDLFVGNPNVWDDVNDGKRTRDGRNTRGFSIFTYSLQDPQI